MFGETAGDETVQYADDGSSTEINSTWPFFETQQNGIFVSVTVIMASSL